MSSLLDTSCDMTTPRNTTALGAAFFAIGIAFMAIGIGGQKAFLGVGAAVLVVGLLYMGKARKGG